MKKTFCLIFLVALTTVVSAQKGSWFLGGVAGFNTTVEKSANDDETTTSNWAFGPEIGTFLSNDIQLGLVLGLSGSSEKTDDTDEFEYSITSPSLYVRKFFKITENFSTFSGLYLNYISGSMTDFNTNGDDDVYDLSGFGARIGIGVAYALSPKFTAVGQYGLLGYQSLNQEVNGNDGGSQTSFDFGVNTVGSSTLSQGNGSGSVFNIGIYYTFLSK